jgi:hypothetical protein
MFSLAGLEASIYYISSDEPHLLIYEKGALAKSLVELLLMVGCP